MKITELNYTWVQNCSSWKHEARRAARCTKHDLHLTRSTIDYKIFINNNLRIPQLSPQKRNCVCASFPTSSSARNAAQFGCGKQAPTTKQPTQAGSQTACHHTTTLITRLDDS